MVHPTSHTFLGFALIPVLPATPRLWVLLVSPAILALCLFCCTNTSAQQQLQGTNPLAYLVSAVVGNERVERIRDMSERLGGALQNRPTMGTTLPALAQDIVVGGLRRAVIPAGQAFFASTQNNPSANRFTQSAVILPRVPGSAQQQVGGMGAGVSNIYTQQEYVIAPQQDRMTEQQQQQREGAIDWPVSQGMAFMPTVPRSLRSSQDDLPMLADGVGGDSLAELYNNLAAPESFSYTSSEFEERLNNPDFRKSVSKMVSEQNSSRQVAHDNAASSLSNFPYLLFPVNPNIADVNSETVARQRLQDEAQPNAEGPQIFGSSAGFGSAILGPLEAVYRTIMGIGGQVLQEYST